MRRPAVRLIRRAWLVLAGCLGASTLVVDVGQPVVAAAVGDGTTVTECAAGPDTASLNQFIADEVGDIVGFDTPRVLALGDGRHLWSGQDAFISANPARRSTSLRPPTGFAHNALIVQDGSCFTTLHRPVTPGAQCSVSDASYVGGDSTASCSHWFWPMGAGIDHTGQVVIFYAEMVNESGHGAAAGAHPASVWMARLDSTTFVVDSFAPAPDPGGDVIYGFSVESDSTFSYLFGWSYDQFNLPDPSSPPPSQLFLARVPRGRFDTVPTYWNGTGWTADRKAATPIDHDVSGAANGMQPRLIDGMWLSAVKADDWHGTTVRIDAAAAPQGPWVTVQAVTVPSRSLNGMTNTYAAHLLPWRSSTGNIVVALSHNAWQMDPVAFGSPTLYQPRLFELSAPAGLTSPRLQPATEPLGFVPLSPPARVADTRRATAVDADGMLRVSLAGVVGPEARVAVLNLTVTSPAAGGYLTAWSCDQPMPPTSSLNYEAGATRATHAAVALAADQSVCVFSSSRAHVIVDAMASYSTAPAALRFHPQPPTRIYDSRPSRRWGAGETRTIAVPSTAAAVAVNVTVTDPTATGFVTVYPCQATLPPVSSVNFVAGQTVANLVQTGSAGGSVCVFSSGRAHIIVDLQGVYDSVGGLRYQAVAPTRLVDTRVGVGSVYGRVGQETRAAGVLPANAPVATSPVPAAVQALMVSLVAVAPRAGGWAEIGPCLEPASTVPYGASTVNFVANEIVANQAITPTRAASGVDVCSFSTSPAFHIVDLVGWFV